MLRTFALALILWPALAWGTPAHVQDAEALSAGPITFTAVGSGHSVCVSAYVTSAVGTPTLTWSDGHSDTFISIASYAPDGSGFGPVAACAFNITTAPTSISVTTSTGAVAAITFDEFSGVSGLDSGTPSAAAFQASIGTGTNAVTTGNYTTATNGDMIWAVDWDNTPIVAGTAPLLFTAGLNDPTNGLMTEFAVQTTASATTAGTFTHATAQNAWTVSAALLASGGGAGGGGSSLPMMGIGN